MHDTTKARWLEPVRGHRFLPARPPLALHCLDQRGVEQLFDISSDPQATRNVAQQYPQLTADFRQRIAAWRREIQQSLTFG